jgi:hypothetical protein
VSLVKVLLILFALGVLCVCLFIGGTVWWFMRNKDDLVARATAARAEGTAYAPGKTNEQCVTEALRRTAAAGDLELITRTCAGFFLDACLESSEPSPDVCAGVPPSSEMMTTVAWRMKECQRRGQPDAQSCGQTLEHLQTFCTARAATPK